MPFVNELLKYNNDYFIETGTYQGDTIDIVKNSNKFKYIYYLVNINQLHLSLYIFNQQ